MKPPDVLDYAAPPQARHAAPPKSAARVSLACCGLFLLSMTGLFGKSPLPFLTPVAGFCAAAVALVQSCLRRSDPTPAALGLILNAACAAFVGYLVFTD